MIIVDKALKRREHEGRPIRIGLVGAGYMGRGIAAQLLTPIPGLRLAAVANRSGDAARRAWGPHGATEAVTSDALCEAVFSERPVYTQDARVLCECPAIDVVIEATGHLESGAQVALWTIAAGKPLVLFSAELDATVGPILKVKADRAGVLITGTAGDEPGVAMNLLRFVETIGYRPVLAGNIKGFLNHHRNPETQREFAAKAGQRPEMITSFADGTKLAFETGILASACGFSVGQPGMFGHTLEHVRDITSHFRPEDLLESGGWVDYALGAEPGSGAFVVGYSEDPLKQPYMKYFKMGEGPLYVFYTPFHLPHLEVAITVGQAVLFEDPTITPMGAPTVDVVAHSKRDLVPGHVLDGIGGFDTYGMLYSASDAREGKFLPMGLAEGCRLTRPVPQDQPIPADAVVRPEGRLLDRLRDEQDAHFTDRPLPRAEDRAAVRPPLRRTGRREVKS